MTLFKHTEPPKESGRYFTDKGELHFNSNDKQWIWGGFPVEIKYWYSPSPPKEIEDIFDKIKQDYAIHKRMGHARVHVEFTFEEAETLLKLRAE